MLATIRPTQHSAWKGASLLIVDAHGECGGSDPLTGFYFREARHLRTLRLTMDGTAPWCCEIADTASDRLDLTFVHPELRHFGGGGSGQSGDGVETDGNGIPYRALDLRLACSLRANGLEVALVITNRSRQTVSTTVAWELSADYADVQEAQGDSRQQSAEVVIEHGGGSVRFGYAHPALPYRTTLTLETPTDVRSTADSLSTRLTLAPGAEERLTLRVAPEDFRDPLTDEEARRREDVLREWRDSLARLTMPHPVPELHVLQQSIRDFASFPLLDGQPDEWLTMQAGMPLYPALFGRDAITAGWQAAMLDRGRVLDASLSRLARLQTSRYDDWRDEEPGRIPYQVRQGPLARLEVNPYSAYYADQASPLMFVIGLAHLYAWSGDRAIVARHWDAARRILDWAREYGDRDGDGYLEYCTRSSVGTKNQGWKDSGDAIIYEDGTPVPAPIATCEIQGYWFAAQQLAAVLSWVMDERDSAKALWSSAMELKRRFNADWWVPDERCPALAMDPDKRLVRAATTNGGHCLATGIIDDEHLPPLVGRLFAPDMFSGWGIRTLSAEHVAYDPLSYHRGSVWAVENATIAFGLRRFGFDTRALELIRAQMDLAMLYPEWRIPETVGGYARGERPTPGAYPRANTPQLWNASGFVLLLHSMLGLQPVAPLDLLVVDPVLPAWLPEIVVHDLSLGGSRATLRFWRDDRGKSHAEVLHHRGTFHLLHQPPLESLDAGIGDRFRALADSILHH